MKKVIVRILFFVLCGVFGRVEREGRVIRWIAGDERIGDGDGISLDFRFFG